MSFGDVPFFFFSNHAISSHNFPAVGPRSFKSSQTVASLSPKKKKKKTPRNVVSIISSSSGGEGAQVSHLWS